MEERNKFLEFIASNTGRLIMIIVGYIIVFSVLLAAVQAQSTAVVVIALLVCAFFGWKALNRITPNIFLFMSFTGWIIYFSIKGFLSIFIGVFVAPYQISKMVSNAINNSVQE